MPAKRPLVDDNQISQNTRSKSKVRNADARNVDAPAAAPVVAEAAAPVVAEAAAPVVADDDALLRPAKRQRTVVNTKDVLLMGAGTIAACLLPISASTLMLSATGLAAIGGVISTRNLMINSCAEEVKQAEKKDDEHHRDPEAEANDRPASKH